jgi:hypothetical protein
MCFNKEFSLIFMGLGISLIYIIIKNPSKFHNMAIYPVILYTIMELVQSLQYLVVNKCSKKTNKYLTEFAYLLLIFQPLMWNYIFLNRERVKGDIEMKKNDMVILKYSIILCILWTIFHLFRRFKFYGEYIDDDEEMKGKKSCTYREGNNHLYWKFKLYNNKFINVNWTLYVILFFLPGLLTDNKKDIFLLISGWLISKIYIIITKQNKHTLGSLWCLSSIPQLFIYYLPNIYEILKNK